VPAPRPVKKFMSTPIHHHPWSRSPIHRRPNLPPQHRGKLPALNSNDLDADTTKPEESSRAEQVAMWIFILLIVALSGVTGWLLWAKAQGDL